MKLAIISVMEGYPWGGSEELWYELAEVALKKNHRVQISLKHWGSGNARAEALKSNGAVIHYRKKSLLNRAAVKILHGTGSYPALFPIERDQTTLLIISEGSAFEFTKNLYWTRFALQTSIPYCFIIQNVFENESLNSVRRERALAVYQQAKALYFVSQNNLEVVQRQLATSFPQAQVINNPVTIPSDPSAALLNLSAGNTVNFAAVGRLDCHSKGQDILLQSLQSDEWKKRKWHLNIYGIGQDRRHLENLANYLGLSDRVSFREFVPVKDIWKENQLLIMPSYNEGTSLALLEAMSHAIPAVVTDVGGQAEWVEEGVNGFVAAAPTVALLAAAMERCWNNKERWEEMGMKAREKIIKNYPLSAGEQLFGKIQQLIP